VQARQYPQALKQSVPAVLTNWVPGKVAGNAIHKSKTFQAPADLLFHISSERMARSFYFLQDGRSPVDDRQQVLKIMVVVSCQTARPTIRNSAALSRRALGK
jgi:hypothetical protein